MALEDGGWDTHLGCGQDFNSLVCQGFIKVKQILLWFPSLVSPVISLEWIEGILSLWLNKEKAK